MKLYRIFLVLGGKATPNDKSRIWVKNLHDPLVSMGHDVYLMDIDEYAEMNGFAYMSSQVKEKLSNDLPQIFNREHDKKPFDIFFSYLHSGQIIPGVLQEIKKKVFTINYSTNFHQFDLYKDVARIVDVNIYISKIAKTGFDELGVKSYWMPLAANPAFYKRSLVKNNHSVFVGSAYGPRAYLFWRLLQYNVNLRLYGNGWIQEDTSGNGNDSFDEIKGANRNFRSALKNGFSATTGYEIRKVGTAAQLKEENVGQDLEKKLRIQQEGVNDTIISLLRRDYSKNLYSSLSDDDYIKVISEAAIVVNIQESRFNHDYFNHRVLFGSNLRDYEVTMCGSFLCTQYSDEIAELFVAGKEIVCYYNEHDLADKIDYYSKNTSQRDSIAQAGYQKSIDKHTWQKRFTAFFEFIDL